MNRAVALPLLMLALTAACDKLPMTQYTYEGVELAVGACATGDGATCDSPDMPDEGATIDVKLLSTNGHAQSILSIDWLLGSGETLSPIKVKDTTPRPSSNGLSLGFGFGFGGLGDANGDQADYPTEGHDSSIADPFGTGIGIYYPMGDDDRITSLTAIFDLTGVDLSDPNHLLIMVATGEDENGLIIAQPLVLPVDLPLQPLKAPTPPQINPVDQPVDLPDLPLPPPRDPVAMRTAPPVYVVISGGDTIITRHADSPMTDDLIETEMVAMTLGDVPLLGRLFKTDPDKVVKRDLLIFVTPKIVAVSD